MLRYSTLRTPFRAPLIQKRAFGSALQLRTYNHPPSDGQNIGPEFAANQRRHEQKLTQESQTAIENKLQRIEKYKALFFGFLALGGILVGYDVYLKFPAYRRRVEAIFGIVDELADSKAKSVLDFKSAKRAAAEIPLVVNPNSSQVPGLYLWGDNSDGMLAAEDMDAATADSTAIRFPMRMKFFDNLLIRDVLLSRRSNVIIDSKGDVYQWGKTYGSETPVKVLKGWKVQKAAISNGVIYLLRGNGEIVFMPELLADQKAFHSDQYRRNWHFGSSELPFSRLSGQFQDIAAGKSHLVALSVDGRVFTASTGLADEDLAQRKNKGQFGVPFITQFDPLPAPNQLHEVALLSHIRQKNRVQRRHITKIAAGNNHTLALDEFGEVWSWGLNTYGQLGQLVNYNSEIIPVPKKITLKGHFKTGIYPVATDVYAGGNFSFAKYQAKDINRFFQQSRNGAEAAPEEEMTDFYFAFGNGINGSLGIGKYVHSQAEPAKIKLLNDMKEYNEAVQEVVSVPVRNWSVGSNHVITTLHNSLNNATDNDVLVWGGNAFGQLGNGKKTQACKPVYVPTLLEPDTGESTDTARMLRLNNINNSRLQIGVRGKAEQVVVAGDNKSALFYRA